MKKSILLILSVCAMVFAISCANDGLDADASRSGTVNPAETIKPGEGGATGSLTTVAAFVNKYAGVYYSQGQHSYRTWADDNSYKIDYKFKDGKVYVPNMHNQLIELMVHPVEAVLPSEKKLQLRNKEKGEVLVLNMTDDGLESYVSYILEKVSDEVLIQNSGVGGFIEELAPYKGTYNSIAADNKVENYIAIDGEGNIYFHDSSVTVDSGRVGITENELTILESYQYSMRKIIFKFNEGVYRRYSIDGEHRDETYIGICEVTKNFVEDVFDNATYKTADYKEEDFVKWENEVPGGQQAPTKITGVAITLNEANDDIGHDVSEGAVAVSGNNIGENKGLSTGNMVGHVSVLKGNTLHIMGRFNAAFEFSPDWKSATYNGQTLTLVGGSVKAGAAPAERRASRRIK